ncbi:hypothetical protein SESBI_13054 [Sesbania bispinosa]|nr:hypothetical protein SESBI_13054 [Sesbania bispinosa]
MPNSSSDELFRFEALWEEHPQCSKDNLSEDFPPEFNNIAGKEVLFKEKKGVDYAFTFYNSFKVRKICLDVSIIDLFKKNLNIATLEAVSILLNFFNLFYIFDFMIFGYCCFPFTPLDDGVEENINPSVEKKPNVGEK